MLRFEFRLDDLAAAAGVAARGDGGGRGGRGGGLASWVIVDDAVARIDGQPRHFEVAGWRAGTPTDIAPDWLCEAAEPDRAMQLARYVGRGIGHVWLLDHGARRIDAYRLGRASWTCVGTAVGSGVLRAEPFVGMALDLSSLWNDQS